MLELLEDRTVPSTFIVNELLDTHAVNLISGVDATGQVSLRSAIEAADSLGGNQTIQFDPSVFAIPQTIPLTLGALDLKDATGTLTIQGPAGGVAVSGSHTSRVFRVEPRTQADLSNLIICDGAPTGNGGGILNAGSLTLQDSTISGDVARYPSGTSINATGGTYANVGEGGGIYNKGNLTAVDCTISGNSAAWGGGVYNAFSGKLSLTTCTISSNTAAKANGKIDTYPITVGGKGGGIWNEHTATVTDSTVSGNTAVSGAGVWSQASTSTSPPMTVNDSIISGNRASQNGGGIYSSCAVTVTNSTISGNSAGSAGGGVDDFGGVTSLENCTLSGNSAKFGGGVYSTLPIDPVTLANCTISGNTASQGGGIWIGYESEVACNNCTISGNAASQGGGVDNWDGALTLNNSIAAGNANQSGGDIAGYVSSPSVNNLIGDGKGITGGIKNHAHGNQIGTHTSPIDPLLAPLGNYGGPTQTMALLPGSPAIDAGSNAAIPAGVTTDQRGLPRILNGTVDIGAFESQGFMLHTVSGNNQDATLNSPLPSPLVVAVTANNAAEPTVGGWLTFTTVNGSMTQTIDADGQATLYMLPQGNVAGPCGVTVSAAGVPLGGSVVFQLTTNPVVTPATTAVPATADSFPLVINGAGFDPSGTNNVTISDLTNPANIVTVGNSTINSTTQLTVAVSGIFADGDVLSAIVTTDGATSAPTAVAVVAPVLTPATVTVPANATAATLLINGYGFDPSGTNTVTITDLTHPTDAVIVGTTAALSAATLSVAVSGTFTGGDVLSAVVTTDGARSASAPVAVAVPVVTAAATFVPARATRARLVINGFGFDPKGTNTVKIADLTHPADEVTVSKISLTSATALTVTLSGKFTAGDVLAAVVTTDGASSATVSVASAVQPSAITSAGKATFAAVQAGTFTVTTAGFPAAALSEAGVLPTGLTWTDNGNGTATLSGTPLAGSARRTPYSFTIHASNGVGTAATQIFKLFIS